MQTNMKLLQNLYTRISPEQFERLIARLLNVLKFGNAEITGRSGDRGIDLKATWTSDLPRIQVDLNFVIQAKRYDPDTTLNPRYLRELRGAMKPGEWGLLVTTARVSPATRQDAISDPSRIVSIIDGADLIELCKQFELGVSKDYTVDVQGIEREEEIEVLTAPSGLPERYESFLEEALSEPFHRFGATPIYKSPAKTLIVRASQYYDRTDHNYWYGTTPKDLERAEEYGVSHFAFICDRKGVALLPKKNVIEQIRERNLYQSPPQGSPRHYHIRFLEKHDRLLWLLRDGQVNVDTYYPLTPPRTV